MSTVSLSVSVNSWMSTPISGWSGTQADTFATTSYLSLRMRPYPVPQPPEWIWPCHKASTDWFWYVPGA
jgi:hypothetical protein